MVVLWVAVVVLIDGPAPEHHLPKQARIHHLCERAVDSGPAGLRPLRRLTEPGQQLLGIEMLVMAADVINDHLSLPRDPLAPRLEKLREPLARRQRDVNLAERKVRCDGHGSFQEMTGSASLNRIRHKSSVPNRRGR